MRVIVVGVDSIGSRHSRNLASLGHRVLVGDTDRDHLREAATLPGIEAAPSLEGALAAKPDAVLICTPPALHLDAAHQALAAGAHLFVEEPSAPTSAGVAALVERGRRGGGEPAVGSHTRFLPSPGRAQALLAE